MRIRAGAPVTPRILRPGKRCPCNGLLRVKLPYYIDFMIIPRFTLTIYVQMNYLFLVDRLRCPDLADTSAWRRKRVMVTLRMHLTWDHSIERIKIVASSGRR